MWIHWPFFPKTWTKGHWPLDDLWPHVCWGHMCDSTQGSLCPSPMTIHQCMWIQWWILQITTYIHILHTYILRTYYVQNEWSHSLLLNSVQARQKKKVSFLGRVRGVRRERAALTYNAWHQVPFCRLTFPVLILHLIYRCPIFSDPLLQTLYFFSPDDPSFNMPGGRGVSLYVTQNIECKVPINRLLSVLILHLTPHIFKTLNPKPPFYQMIKSL